MWQILRTMGIGNTRVQVEKISVFLDSLNEHFTLVNSPSRDTTVTQQIMNIFQTPTHPTHDKFHYSYITPDNVIPALNHIKNNAIGVVSVSKTLVRKILPLILNTLTHIFNTFVITATFPTLWEKHVHPIPKVKVPTITSDYHPVSVLLPYRKCWNKSFISSLQTI